MTDKNMLMKTFKTVVCLLLTFIVGQAYSQDEQVDVVVDFPTIQNNAQAKLEPGASPYNWEMSSTPPKIILISSGDLDIPIQVSTGEFILSDSNAGVFKFYDGKISSATINTVNKITAVPQPNCSPHCPSNTKYRPTLFVSIQGLDIDTESIDQWQSDLDLTLMRMVSSLHYRHIAIDWQATRQILPQAIDAADAIKLFLSTQDYPWNVVLIGHSRGGIFAHELSKLLAGNDNIKNLHVMLLDPTAAPLVGDLYPTEKAPGVFGYLKFDGQIFSYLQAGTVADRTILGYDNYGVGDNQKVFCPGCNPDDSHKRYAADWLADVNGFNQVKSRILKPTDTGFFSYKEESGMEILTLTTSDFNVALTSVCTDTDTDTETGSCSVNGTLTLGPGTSVSLYNMISLDGVDVSVATAAASASAVIRRDQIAIEQTDLFTSNSVRVTSSGLATNNRILFGNGDVKTKIDKSGGSVRINVGGHNIVDESIGPLDAIVPGANHVKSELKKLKKKRKKIFGF